MNPADTSAASGTRFDEGAPPKGRHPVFRKGERGEHASPLLVLSGFWVTTTPPEFWGTHLERPPLSVRDRGPRAAQPESTCPDGYQPGLRSGVQSNRSQELLKQRR